MQPRVNVAPKSSPASSRTAELPFSSAIKSSRPANAAGLEHKMRPTRRFTPGCSQPCRKKRGTSLEWHRQTCSMLRLYHAAVGEHPVGSEQRAYCPATPACFPLCFTWAAIFCTACASSAGECILKLVPSSDLVTYSTTSGNSRPNSQLGMYSR